MLRFAGSKSDRSEEQVLETSHSKHVPFGVDLSPESSARPVKASGFVRQAKPLVSVLMPIYNTRQYLCEAIQSVLQQDCAFSCELILVDDGSTDGSLEVALEYAASHPGQIRLLRHANGENRGISASRNLALGRAEGDFIAFLDSDDVWLPHHLSTLCDVLHGNSSAAAVYGSAERWVHFDQECRPESSATAWWGENYLPPLVPSGELAGLLPRGKLLRWFLDDESMVPCICSMLVRTQAARAVGGFVDEFRGLYDDQAFHAKLSLRYSVYAADVCVARYRMHPGSCCASGRSNQRVAEVERRRFLEFVNRYDLHREYQVSNSTASSGTASPSPVEELEECTSQSR